MPWELKNKNSFESDTKQAIKIIHEKYNECEPHLYTHIFSNIYYYVK